MKNATLRFQFSLITLLVYELAMLVFGLDGVSIGKLIVVALVWVSFFVAFFEYVKYWKVLKKRIPGFAYLVLTALFFWNILGVIRSIINKDGPLATILGNVVASLAILIPFVLIFSINKNGIRIIQSYFLRVLKLGIPVFVLLFIMYGSGMNSSQLRTLLVFFLPVVFLITILPFQTKKNKILILVSGIILFYVASLHSVRTMMIREIVLVACLVAIHIYHRYRAKGVLVFSCLILLIPPILLKQSYDSGESVIEKYLSDSSDDELSNDTRTFLYMELFNDLVINEKLLVGKGANGTYYSEYFNSADVNETDNRNNLEVGILGMLLKGGFIAVILNILILIVAIYYAFFKSNNTYVTGVGYVLLVHTFLLFIENYLVFSGYNFALWFFTGVALSKQMRQMSNAEIQALLRTKKRVK